MSTPISTKPNFVFYHCERVSVAIIFLVFLCECLVILDMAMNGFSTYTILFTAVFALLLVNVYRINMILYLERLEISHGIGLLRRTIPIRQIASYYICSNDSVVGRLYYPLANLVLAIEVKGKGRLLLPVPDTKAVMDALNRIIEKAS